MSATRAAPRGALLHAALVLLGALLYLPHFASEELDDEEGRRAVPAREMIESGDYVLPTVFGRPYLAKPPLFFWCIAGASLVTGGVDEAATRLPSVLATIATALALLELGRRTGRTRAGFAGGVTLLVSLAAFEKGAFGELEAVLALWSFVACAALVAERRLAAGLFLAAALLTKGPPALVFFAAAGVAAALVRRERALRVLAAGGVALAVGLAALGGWAWLVAERTSSQGALDLWASEVARSDASGGTWWKDRADLLVGAGTGFLPGLALWALALGTAARRRALADPTQRTAELGALLALLVFALFRGTRARYVYPLLPCVAWLAGRLLDELRAGEPFARRTAVALRALAGLGLAVAGAAAWLAMGSIGDLEGLRAPGAAVAALLLAASVLLWRTAPALARDGSRRPLVLAATVLALLQGLRTLEVAPRTAGHRGRRAAAARIDEAVPPGAVLRVWTRGLTNELFYARHRVVDAGDPLALAPGEWLVLELDALPALRERGLACEVAATVRTHSKRDFAVARIGPRGE